MKSFFKKYWLAMVTLVVLATLLIFVIPWQERSYLERDIKEVKDISLYAVIVIVIILYLVGLIFVIRTARTKTAIGSYLFNAFVFLIGVFFSYARSFYQVVIY